MHFDAFCTFRQRDMDFPFLTYALLQSAFFLRKSWNLYLNKWHLRHQNADFSYKKSWIVFHVWTVASYKWHFQSMGKTFTEVASCLKYQEFVLGEKEVRTCSMCGHMLARLAQWWLRCSVDNSMGTVWSGPPTPCNPRTDSPRSNPHSGLSRWIRWRQTCLLHYLTGCWQPFACSWRCSN